ncbi:unnamed protein product, partial [Oppiella nova]
QTSPSDKCITELKANQQYCGEQAAIVSGFGNKSLNLDYIKVQCCVGWLRMDCFNKVVRERCDSYEYNATHRNIKLQSDMIRIHLRHDQKISDIGRPEYDDSEVTIYAPEWVREAIDILSGHIPKGTGLCITGGNGVTKIGNLTLKDCVIMSRLISDWVLPDPTISAECELKYDQASKECGEKYGYEWRQKISSNDLANNANQRHKMFCCMKWDVSDCMEQFIKVECTEEDYEVIAEIFKKKVDYLSKGNCSQYAYKAPECQSNSVADSLQSDSNSSQSLTQTLIFIIISFVRKKYSVAEK